ncbi:MAG: hypothetical protein Q8M16_06405 [Pirellulaceae bacterium]|nr:hypothetical protein [Pirellulaceae bacterium]
MKKSFGVGFDVHFSTSEYDAMPERPLDRLEPISFAPGGQGLVVDLVFRIMQLFMKDFKLTVSADGVRAGTQFGGRTDVSWPQVRSVGTGRALPPLPFDGTVTLIHDAGSLGLSLYAHVPYENLATQLCVYKVCYVLSDPTAADEDVVATTVALTDKLHYDPTGEDWHWLIRSMHNWTIWALVGNARPDLLPACFHTQAISPVQQMIANLGREQAFEALAAIRETAIPCPAACVALNWMSRNWQTFEPAMDRALTLRCAEDQAGRGPFGKDRLGQDQSVGTSGGSGQVIIRGTSIDLDRLLPSCTTLHEARQHAGLRDCDLVVFYDRFYPFVAQGVVWTGDRGEAVWFWIDRGQLKGNQLRNWEPNALCDCSISAVEYHDGTTHVTRWKSHERDNMHERFSVP